MPAGRFHKSRHRAPTGAWAGRILPRRRVTPFAPDPRRGPKIPATKEAATLGAKRELFASLHRSSSVRKPLAGSWLAAYAADIMSAFPGSALVLVYQTRAWYGLR